MFAHPDKLILFHQFIAVHEKVSFDDIDEEGQTSLICCPEREANAFPCHFISSLEF